jgi:hypothetical protein
MFPVEMLEVEFGLPMQFSHPDFPEPSVNGIKNFFVAYDKSCVVSKGVLFSICQIFVLF